MDLGLIFMALITRSRMPAKLRPQLTINAPATAEEDLHPLVEALVCDTHTAALMTAVIASIVNTLREPSGARSQADLEIYLPQQPALLLALPRWASETGIGTSVLASIVGFFADAENARLQTGHYFTDANLMGLERAAALHQFILAKAWRSVCRSAAAAVEDLNDDSGEVLPELYMLNAGVLKRLLDAAAHGEAPCVDAQGRPYLPALPQRRRSSRRMVGQPAMVTAAGTTMRAFVRDVSTGGFGLEQVGLLDTGASVVVELPTGRRFAGEVVWYKRRRSGIRFTRPLSPNDPLLWG
jgi:hypothetical protein